MFSRKQNKNYHSKILLDEKKTLHLHHDVLYHFVFLYISTVRQAVFALDNKK